MKNHTKGNWETAGVARKDVLDPAFYHVDVLCNDTIRVAKSSGVGEENALANARLIAAAPDLLAACKAWLKVESEMSANNPCPDYGLRATYRKEAVKLTEAAIAKVS